MAVLFESGRTFHLWRAIVGHSQLLLRSNKHGRDETRVDVLFKSVTAMKLNTTLDGLVVREADGHEIEEISKEVGHATVDGGRQFVIESAGFKGYVLASTVESVADQGDYGDPSLLLVDVSDFAQT